MRGDNRLNDLLFGGEAMHADTDKALVLAGFAGAIIGTIRPEEPIEHIGVKLGVASVTIIAAMRIHPGAEKIARDWQQRDEVGGGEQW